MDENKNTGAQQEAQPAGVEAQAEQAAKAVEAEAQPAAGTAKPDQEPKGDKETEHQDAGAKPADGKPAAAVEAVKPAEGAAPPVNTAPDPATQLAVANQRITDMRTALLTAKAEAKAAALGVKPERLKYALRMAELAGIDPMADDADGKIGEKLQAIVTDMPELIGGGGTGSSGAFRRQGTKPEEDAFTRGLKG